MRATGEGVTLAFGDAEGDGSASRDELVAKTGAWRALLDRDSCGAVTEGDFGRD